MDLLGKNNKAANATADHYSKQWSPHIGFLQFIKANPQALCHMPSGQRGWPDVLALGSSMTPDAGMVVCSVRQLPISAPIFTMSCRILCAQPACRSRSLASLDGIHLSRRQSPDALTMRSAATRSCIPQIHEPTLRSVVVGLNLGGTVAVSVYARKALLDNALTRTHCTVITCRGVCTDSPIYIAWQRSSQCARSHRHPRRLIVSRH